LVQEKTDGTSHRRKKTDKWSTSEKETVEELVLSFVSNHPIYSVYNPFSVFFFVQAGILSAQHF